MSQLTAAELEKMIARHTPPEAMQQLQQNPHSLKVKMDQGRKMVNELMPDKGIS